MRVLLGLLTMLLALSSKAATGGLLNIDFGNAAVAPAPVGPAAIGSMDDVWNLSSQPFIPVNHLENLRYADGSASSVGLVVNNAPGAWVVPDSPPMFFIYAYSYGGPITITLTNLPTGRYSFFAYGHGERNELTTRFNLRAAGADYGELTTENSERYRTQPWQEGAHYIVFRDVAVSVDQPVILTASGTAVSTPFLNGLQILRLDDARPGISPNGASFRSRQQVALTDAVQGRELRYTLDGSEPGFESTPYSGPFFLTSSATLKVRAFRNGEPDSPVASAVFERLPDLPPSLINVDFGNAAVAGAPVGPAAIGLENDVWNLSSQPFVPNHHLTNLILANGSPSEVGMSVSNAPGAWTVPGTPPMFSIYAYSYGGPISVTFTNLPSGTYDLFLYGHGAADAAATEFAVTSDEVDYGRLATAQGPGWGANFYQEGEQNDIKKSDLEKNEMPLAVTAHSVLGQTTPFLNGLQLAPAIANPLRMVPAPGLFTNQVRVTFTGGSSGTSVHYTLDGSEPTTNSLAFIRSIQLRERTSIKVREFRAGAAVGETVFGEYLRAYAVDDGISADWRRQHFGADYLTDPRVPAAADPDNDGADNLREFAAGTDPLDPLSGFAVNVRPVPAITWRSVAGKSYRVLRKQQLSDVQWEVFQMVNATADSTRYIDADVDKTYFYAIEPVR